MDRSERLGTEKPLKLLLSFSIPAIIGMLVQATYNVISRVFIGRSLGSLGIAGITVAFPLMMLQIAFGFMIGMGGATLVSIRLGQKKKEEAEEIMGTALVLILLISVVFTLVCLLFLDPLLILFGASDQVLPYAREYAFIVLLGTTIGLLSFGMNSFLRAEGQPKKAMVTMLLGSVSNIILTPVFVYVLHMGMAGAAIATVISQSFSAAWILAHFALGKGELKIRRQNLTLNRAYVTKILYFGLSPFSMQLAQSLLNAVMNASLLKYGGDTAISGMGIVFALMSLIMMPIIGINTGAQPLIGYNFGARHFCRVRTLLLYTIGAATVIATLGFFMTRLFPEAMITLFNSKDQALIDFGTRALLIVLIFLPIVGFQIVGAGYFQAVGKPITAMILSLSRQLLIFIPALLILPRFFGLDGVLYAGPLADVIATVITGIWLSFEIKDLNGKCRTNLLPEKGQG